MTASPRVHLLTAVLLGTPACATMAVQGSTRVDAVANLQDGSVVPSVQLAPTVTWQPDHGGTSAAYVPLAFLEARQGGASRLYQRLRVEHAPVRSTGIHPFVRVEGEYGRTRATDLPLDGELSIAPRPDGTTLDAYLVRAEGGVRGSVSRRTSVSLRGLGERTGGLGRDAERLPGQTRGVVSAGLGRLLSRRDALAIELTAAVTDLDDGPRQVVAGASLGAMRALSRTLTAGVTGGVAVASGEGVGGTGQGAPARPLLGASLRMAGPASSTRASLALQLRPEVDRLDGGLRQRLFARAGVERSTGATTTLHFGAQWAMDLGRPAEARRLLSVDGAVRLGRPGAGVVELGARLFLQGGGVSNARQAGNEVRTWVGWTIRPGRR